MKTLTRGTWWAGALVLVLSAPMAEAGSGTISFSGAITAPTVGFRTALLRAGQASPGATLARFSQQEAGLSEVLRTLSGLSGSAQEDAALKAMRLTTYNYD